MLLTMAMENQFLLQKHSEIMKFVVRSESDHFLRSISIITRPTFARQSARRAIWIHDGLGFKWLYYRSTSISNET